MGRRKDKQTGVSVVETLIIVAVIGIIGVAGWFVYQHNQPKATNTAADADQPTNQQKSTATTQPPADPYAGWQTYTDTDYGVASGISIKYPPEWHVDTTSTKTYGWSIIETANPKNIVTVNDIYSDGSQTAQQEWESCYTTDACLGSAGEKILSGSESTINGLDAYSATIETSYGTFHMTMIRGDKSTPPAGAPYVWFTTYTTDQSALDTFAKIMASATFPK